MYSVGIDDITKNTSITDGKVIGEGIFDKLMETATLHLKAQFDEGRIRGEDFAQAYMAVYTANLSTALQILLQQHIVKLQADNLAKDVELKEQSLLLGLKELDLKDKELELRDKELSLADKNLEIKQAELDLAIYQLEEILPVNKDNLLKDIEVKTAQISSIEKDNLVKEANITAIEKDNLIKDVQILSIEKDNLVKDYELANILPLNKDSLSKDIEVKTVQISSITKDNLVKDSQILSMEKDNLLKDYQLEEILPANKDNLLKDVVVKETQILGIEKDNLVKEAQITGITKDNSIKDYQLSNVLPKEVLKLQEETNLLTRQESELSLNGTADRAIKSSQKLLVDGQTITETAKKLLIDRQREGFDDKALLDTLKHLLDSWSVGFSVANGTPEFTGIPSSISNAVIDKFTKKIGDGLDVNTGLT